MAVPQFHCAFYEMFPFFCFEPLLISSFCCILENTAASAVITTKQKSSVKSKSETSAAPRYERDAHLHHKWYFYLAAFWDSAQVFCLQHRCGHTHGTESLNPSSHCEISLRETGPTSQVLHCPRLLSSLCEGWAAEKHKRRWFLWEHMQKKMLLYSS